MLWCLLNSHRLWRFRFLHYFSRFLFRSALFPFKLYRSRSYKDIFHVIMSCNENLLLSLPSQEHWRPEIENSILYFQIRLTRQVAAQTYIWFVTGTINLPERPLIELSKTALCNALYSSWRWMCFNWIPKMVHTIHSIPELLTFLLGKRTFI